MKVGISFGAMADPLKDQLKSQGLKMGAEKCNHFQLDIDALIRLSIRGVLCDSDANRTRRKLMKRILAEVELS